ncbi:hypothetical protein CTI12_AA184370 [Artemisia annua]|uniref:Uncharacterized protein n=1 Tax=Artemisia annua TaxID=35608 RepID=A0A2U1P4J8_ARTAN|nr:hypothetical protein CTI12_AA184370 [Artemisia annua]
MNQFPVLPPITKEAILSLNNGSVTFEQARALFDVDLSDFKAKLVQKNIFVWNEVNGPVRIHGGDYSITIVIKGIPECYVVHGTDPFENVIGMIEGNLGCLLNVTH